MSAWQPGMSTLQGGNDPIREIAVRADHSRASVTEDVDVHVRAEAPPLLSAPSTRSALRRDRLAVPHRIARSARTFGMQPHTATYTGDSGKDEADNRKGVHSACHSS